LQPVENVKNIRTILSTLRRMDITPFPFIKYMCHFTIAFKSVSTGQMKVLRTFFNCRAIDYVQ
jgi:hypothetical protein